MAGPAPRPPRSCSFGSARLGLTDCYAGNSAPECIINLHSHHLFAESRAWGYLGWSMLNSSTALPPRWPSRGGISGEKRWQVQGNSATYGWLCIAPMGKMLDRRCTPVPVHCFYVYFLAVLSSSVAHSWCL